MAVYASIEDLRKAAEASLPKPFYDYLQNGSFTQTTLDANRADLNAVKLHQRLLDVPHAGRTATTLLGQDVTMPVVLAPVGLSGANHTKGEILAAKAARDFGVPYCLSTFSIASIEDVAAAVGGHFWFQLYAMSDQKINESLVGRAKAAGCPALILTIDAQVEGTRYHDIHNGLGVPPKLSPANVWSVMTHPRWAFGMLSSPHWTFGNMIGENAAGGLEDLAKLVKTALRPQIDAEFLAWLRKTWTGKLVIKGILDLEDLRIAAESGADAVVVSNHGGRQLEGALSSVKVLPRIIAAANPGLEIYVDSGIRTGIDVLRFLGLGARGCLIGRAYNYGLAADGQAGVLKALQILKDELVRTMAMTGVSDLTALPANLIESAPG